MDGSSELDFQANRTPIVPSRMATRIPILMGRDLSIDERFYRQTELRPCRGFSICVQMGVIVGKMLEGVCHLIFLQQYEQPFAP